MEFSQEESRALTYIRVFSMLAIVICHICQTYSRTNHWAYLFNIGVQVFLALSGYLYGHKIITNWKQFYVGRIKRVYIPFVLFLVLVLPFYLIFHRDVFSWKAYLLNFTNLQGVAFAMGGGMIPGIRHLWFLTAIMFGYLITPFLQRIAKYADCLLPFIIICVGIGYVFVPGAIVFPASWIYIYAICYLYCHLHNTKVYDIGLLVLSVILAILICFSGWEVITSYFNPLSRCFHDIIGVFTVVWGVKILNNVGKIKLPYFVGVLDRYSFYIYIIHYFFIIGPFSLARITPCVMLNICIILFVSAIATFVLVWIIRKVNVMIFNSK